MKEEFLIERNGKQFVLYAGLLDEAHSRGLSSIDTELLQVPSAENGDCAIVHAVVRMEEGKFTGIGDASPDNVGRNIKPHIIRMAETRAKARAMRDAVNITAALMEDASTHEEEDIPKENNVHELAAIDGDGITQAQMRMIYPLLKELGYTKEKFEEKFNIRIKELSRSRASDMISYLQEEAQKGANA